MNEVFVMAAQNMVVATLLAGLVYALSRLWRNPPLVHVLWLLVLLKLVAPPVVCVEWAALSRFNARETGGQAAAELSHSVADDARHRPPPVDQRPARAIEPAPATSIASHDVAASAGQIWSRARPLLFSLWLGGAMVCALVAAVRIVRFERMLSDTLPASERVQKMAREIAGRLGIRRVPAVRYVERAEVPLLWCAGRRPTIVLPTRLLVRLEDDQAALILAHELAHLRRCDHLVRAVEMIVSIVYWWNPLVWAVRRQMHRAEDQCCDAWVGWAFPDCKRRYAELLLHAAESLATSSLGARLLPASPFLRSSSLKERVQMILESRIAPSVPARSKIALALLALLILPLFVATTAPKVSAGANDETSPATPRGQNAQTGSEFPYTVRFEQGATRFSGGDKITIEEVRGTADTFARGNIYCVKGKYTLASRDRAILLASATVKDLDSGLLRLQDIRVRSDFFSPGLGRDPGNATGVELKVQRTDVTRGSGTFTLFFSTPFGGFPHVSFCSVEKGGASFGGTYFGTGDSVLKEWWNTDPIPTMPDPPADIEYSHVLKFEQGVTRFLEGDNITIEEIRGTSDTFAPGNFYQIKGTYSLASHDRAKLSAYTTAMEAAHGRSTPSKVQSTVVNRGDGTFTLVLPVTHKGWPHVSFYPADGGQGFGGNYFGTGDSTLKRWWGSRESQ